MEHTTFQTTRHMMGTSPENREFTQLILRGLLGAVMEQAERFEAEMVRLGLLKESHILRWEIAPGFNQGEGCWQTSTELLWLGPEMNTSIDSRSEYWYQGFMDHDMDGRFFPVRNTMKKLISRMSFRGNSCDIWTEFEGCGLEAELIRSQGISGLIQLLCKRGGIPFPESIPTPAS